MSRKNTVNLNDKRIDKRFATWLAIAIALIAPKFLWIVAGRGTSKTSDIQAERFMDVCYDMPGAYFAWVSDTYVNALKNIIPALIEGLNRKGWHEGIHYVIDKPPLAHFDKPYKAPQSYKHTISVFNGCFVNIISMDQPSGAAGNSYQHLFGDEAKYLDFNKIKKLTPALRGYKKFSSSVYYRGSTFTTDMPNVADGEFDWILDREKEMNEEQCQIALRTALVINEIQIEKMNEEKAGNAQKVIQLQKQLFRWEKRWRKVRKESTFFKVVSSYVNVDFLSPEWFKDSLMHLGTEEFKTAVGSFPAKAKKGERFYINLADHHFYDDGIDTEFYEKYDLGDENIKESSLAQRFLNKNKAIDIGVDFGNMCSMVTGQESGEFVFLFKEFYTLPPHHLRELADQFLAFYEDHPYKYVNFYFDRSGNQNASVGKDYATELSNYLTYHVDGTRTGWKVEMMNKGQYTIFHYQEYQLMKNIMIEDNKFLPKLRICKFGCPNLRSAMGKTKTVVEKDKRSGRPFIGKNKTSEKLHFSRLPRESTNIPDAMKYFFFRKHWVEASGRKQKEYRSMEPEILE